MSVEGGVNYLALKFSTGMEIFLFPTGFFFSMVLWISLESTENESSSGLTGEMLSCTILNTSFFIS